MFRIKQLAILSLLAVLFLYAPVSAQRGKKNLEQPSQFDPTKRPKNLSDEELLELVQRQTFRYFWDFAHPTSFMRSEEHTSELQSRENLVCRLLLEKKN